MANKILASKIHVKIELRKKLWLNDGNWLQNLLWRGHHVSIIKLKMSSSVSDGSEVPGMTIASQEPSSNSKM